MPKSKVRKKNDFTINPVSRTPVKVKTGPSSVWFVALFVRPHADRAGVAYGLPVGRAGRDPRAAQLDGRLGPWNYAIAFAFMISGLLLTMRWR